MHGRGEDCGLLSLATAPSPSMCSCLFGGTEEVEEEESSEWEEKG